MSYYKVVKLDKVGGYISAIASPGFLKSEYDQHVNSSINNGITVTYTVEMPLNLLKECNLGYDRMRRCISLIS